MATPEESKKKESVNNPAEKVGDIAAPAENIPTENADAAPVGEVSDEKAEEVIADAVDGKAEGNTPTDPIATQLPNVEITEANRAEIEALIARAEYGDRSKENNQKIAEILQSDPDLPAIFMDISKGATFQEAAARRIDFSAAIPPEGDPDYDKWSKADGERRTNFEKRKTQEATISENKKKTEAMLASVRSEDFPDMTDEEFNEKWDSFLSLLSDALMYNVSKKTLMMYFNDLTRDSDLENAKTEGEIKGKNLKIADLQDKDKKKAGTGLPDIVGGGSAPKQAENKDPFIEGLKNRTSRKKVLG